MTIPEAAIPKPGPHEVEVEKRRVELAMLEGHDADIPTEEQPIAVDDGYKPPESLTARESTPSPATTDHEQLSDVEKGRTSAHEEEGEHMEKQGVQASDPNIVDWDGPDDPENPLNWSSGLKWGIVSTISSITFIT